MMVFGSKHFVCALSLLGGEFEFHHQSLVGYLGLLVVEVVLELELLLVLGLVLILVLGLVLELVLELLPVLVPGRMNGVILFPRQW